MAPGGQLRSKQQSTLARRSSEEEDVWKASTLCSAATAHPGLAPLLTFPPQPSVQAEEQQNGIAAKSAPVLNVAGS